MTGSQAKLGLGAIAQLVERVLCKHEVVGSIPSGSTRLRAVRSDRERSGFRPLERSAPGRRENLIVNGRVPPARKRLEDGPEKTSIVWQIQSACAGLS